MTQPSVCRMNIVYCAVLQLAILVAGTALTFAADELKSEQCSSGCCAGITSLSEGWLLIL